MITNYLHARREFAKQYGKDLIAEVRSETSGNYRDLLVGLCKKIF